MKNFTLTFLIALVFLQSFAQSFSTAEGSYLTDSVIETHSYPAFFVRVSNKDQFKYNPNNDIKLHERYTNTKEYYEPVEWKKTEKTISSFDEEGRLSEVIWQERAVDEEDWLNDKMTAYSYEPDKKIRIGHLWGDSLWLKQSRVTNAWDAEKRHSSQLLERWDTAINDWESRYSYDTIFTIDGMFDTIIYFVWSAGEKEAGIVEAFDYTFYPDTIISHHRNGDLYYLIKKYHDTALTADVEFKYKYIDSTASFRPSVKQLWYLDSQQNVIRDDILSWYFNEQEWKLAQRVDYHYNAENLLDEKLVYGPGSIYSIFEKRQYFYNDLLMLSKEVDYFYPMDDDSWTMYEYYYILKYVDVPENPPVPKSIAYPNPVQNRLIIDNAKLLYQQYQIYDLNGKLLQSGKLSGALNTIEVTRLPAGDYVLTLSGNSTTVSQKIMKIE